MLVTFHYSGKPCFSGMNTNKKGSPQSYMTRNSPNLNLLFYGYVSKDNGCKNELLILYCRQYEDDIEHCVENAQRNEQTENITFVFAASRFPHQNQLLWLLMIF